MINFSSPPQHYVSSRVVETLYSCSAIYSGNMIILVSETMIFLAQRFLLQASPSKSHCLEISNQRINLMALEKKKISDLILIKIIQINIL